MTGVAGGLPVVATKFNEIAVGLQPSNPFAGQLWVDDTPDNGITSYLRDATQFNLLNSAGARVHQLAYSEASYVVSSEVADTTLFEITGIDVATAHMLRLNLRYTTTGAGTPLFRFGFRVNSTTVNTTASGPGFEVNAGAGALSIVVCTRLGGANLGFFQAPSNKIAKLGVSAGIPTATISSLRVTVQMLGASRSVTVNHYELWEYR